MNKELHPLPDPWEGMEVIHAYTRAQALEDGVLVDVTTWAKESGFRLPVAVTRGVWSILEPSEELRAQGQDATGRAWDMLTILRYAIRNAPRTDEVRFAPLFALEPGRAAVPVEMWAKCGPGDGREAVITVMLEGED